MPAGTDAPRIMSMELDSFDPEALQSILQDSSLDHVQLSSERFRGRAFNADHRDSCIAWGHYNTPILAEGPTAPERPTIGMLLAGRGDAVFNRERIGRERVMFFGEGAELCTVLPARCTWLSFQTDRARLAAAGIERLSQGFSHEGLLGPLVPMLADLMLAALAVIEDPDSTIAAAAQSMADIEDRLLSAIAASERVPVRVYGSRPRSPRRSDRSVAQDVAEYLRWNLESEDLRIMDVCLELGQPIKNVERSFARTYGMPPKRYLTLQRLTRLRRKIKSGEADERKLTDLYLDCGLAHFSRAAADYRALYGELPSKT